MSVKRGRMYDMTYKKLAVKKRKTRKDTGQFYQWCFLRLIPKIFIA